MRERILIFLALLSGVAAQEIFLHGARPYIIVRPRENRRESETFPDIFRRRLGPLEDSSEESYDGDDEDDRIIIKKFTPPRPDDPKSSQRPLPTRRLPSRTPSRTENLKADPAPLPDKKQDEDKGAGFRFLWPFQVSISKTKGHPEGYHSGYYEHYPTTYYHYPSHGHHHKKGYDIIGDEFKGLSPHDLKILNSKGYKKYLKKKKKKIKKVKKKLKFKRAIQKLLEKKIAKLDAIAPEFY